jgi:DNA-binding LytR/AlgR family response regulator
MRNERCIIIDKGTTFHCIAISHLVYVEADGNYSNFKMRDSKNDFTLTMQLGEMEDIIDKTRGVTNFARIGRSLIVNLDYVRSIDLSKGKFVLSDNLYFRKELGASHIALASLKAAVEDRVKKARRNEDE